MKKQPEPFTLVRYNYGPFGCSIEGNALALQVSSVGGYALVSYINQLIEERAELLTALQKMQATVNDLDYEPSHDGANFLALKEAKIAANEAIEKATSWLQ